MFKYYRGAVRLLYLQTLKIFSEANIIRYQPDYTNFSYVQQLFQTKFYDEFCTDRRRPFAFDEKASSPYAPCPAFDLLSLRGIVFDPYG